MKCAKDLLPLNVLYWLSTFIHHHHHIIIIIIISSMGINKILSYLILQALHLSDEVLCCRKQRDVTIMTKKIISDHSTQSFFRNIM